MKREICCPKCSRQWESVAKEPEVIDAGEAVIIRHGLSRKSCVCDGCNVGINEGDQCAAVSLLNPGESARDWEHEYVAAASREAGARS